MCWRSVLIMSLLFGAAIPVQADEPPSKKAPLISWKRTVIDKAFRSEGVAVADINKDGKPDVIVGDVWYEAPDWKLHVIRKDRKFNPGPQYSECFGCFADDFNGDGWIDVLVMPFPGKACYWYQNPGSQGSPWKEHMITHSGCNETPLYTDLFGDGKRVIVMGVQPKGQDNMGQMFWLRPGKDPTQPWEHHPISVPSEKGKIVPGTFRFSHGLGVGDVNGDTRNDVITTAGWWEQPANRDSDQPWTFHPANLGDACADMYALDIDNDGRRDIISTSAHQFGMWWYQQKGPKENPVFVRHEMFPGVSVVADKRNYSLTAEEKTLLDSVNKFRAGKGLRPLLATPSLCEAARRVAAGREVALESVPNRVLNASGDLGVSQWFQVWTKSPSKQGVLLGDWRKIGVASRSERGQTQIGVVVVKEGMPRTSGIVVWEGMKKQLVGQTHALHLADINGDGIKDLVTGRRFWAHGPNGDAAPTEPAFLFWFEGRRGKDGIMTFLPHLIDDDSGIATQFAVNDINGDGLLDVIVSNKKGVYVFEQVRTPDGARPAGKE